MASSAEADQTAGRRGRPDGDGGAGGGGGGIDDDGEEKLTYGDRPLIEEEWWKTTLQVSIPFFIAGIGTIGAGVILGRVEVSYMCSDTHYLSIVIDMRYNLFSIHHNFIYNFNQEAAARMKRFHLC